MYRKFEETNCIFGKIGIVKTSAKSGTSGTNITMPISQLENFQIL